MMFKRILLLLLTSGFTGSLAFFYVQPQIEQSQMETTEAWLLPVIPVAIDKNKLYADLRQWQLWGSEIEKKEDKKAEKKKKDKKKADDDLNEQLAAQFVGVIKKGNERYILLLNDEKQAKPYYAQTQLPNGVLLVNIQEDAITIQKEDEDAQTIPLY